MGGLRFITFVVFEVLFAVQLSDSTAEQLVSRLYDSLQNLSPYELKVSASKINAYRVTFGAMVPSLLGLERSTWLTGGQPQLRASERTLANGSKQVTTFSFDEHHVYFTVQLLSAEQKCLLAQEASRRYQVEILPTQFTSKLNEVFQDNSASMQLQCKVKVTLHNGSSVVLTGKLDNRTKQSDIEASSAEGAESYLVKLDRIAAYDEAFTCWNSPSVGRAGDDAILQGSTDGCHGLMQRINQINCNLELFPKFHGLTDDNKQYWTMELVISNITSWLKAHLLKNLENKSMALNELLNQLNSFVRDDDADILWNVSISGKVEPAEIKVYMVNATAFDVNSVFPLFSESATLKLSEPVLWSPSTYRSDVKPLQCNSKEQTIACRLQPNCVDCIFSFCTIFKPTSAAPDHSKIKNLRFYGVLIKHLKDCTLWLETLPQIESEFVATNTVGLGKCLSNMRHPLDFSKSLTSVTLDGLDDVDNVWLNLNSSNLFAKLHGATIQRLTLVVTDLASAYTGSFLKNITVFNYLRLSGAIKSIERNDFDNLDLRSLRTLDLSNNSLCYIDFRAFSKTNNFADVKLNGNPLYADSDTWSTWSSKHADGVVVALDCTDDYDRFSKTMNEVERKTFELKEGITGYTYTAVVFGSIEKKTSWIYFEVCAALLFTLLFVFAVAFYRQKVKQRQSQENAAGLKVAYTADADNESVYSNINFNVSCNSEAAQGSSEQKEKQDSNAYELEFVNQNQNGVYDLPIVTSDTSQENPYEDS